MSVRFASAVIAFAFATALASSTALLPEAAAQFADPNLLGGAIFSAVLRHFGYACVAALCGSLAAGAILLSGWRARTRGATDWYVTLASLLCALCLLGRAGIGLDCIGWLCAAAFCLLSDRDDDAGVAAALTITAIWSVAQGGATLAALLAAANLAGAYADTRTFDASIRRKAVLAGGTALLSLFQLHAAPWHAYGAHVLYLDSAISGIGRDLLWNGSVTVPALGFVLLVTLAAWYGIRRRGRSADALVFFATALLAIADARNLPYFGIACAPIAADAAASYYLAQRTFPIGTVRQYAVTFVTCALSFIAVFTATRASVFAWPHRSVEAVSLLADAGARIQITRVLCTDPHECDGIAGAVVDDRVGLATPRELRLFRDVTRTRGQWRQELQSNGVDAVIAPRGGDVAALLSGSGWRESARAASIVLLLREDPR